MLLYQEDNQAIAGQHIPSRRFCKWRYGSVGIDMAVEVNLRSFT